jgi:hypothetical protein
MSNADAKILRDVKEYIGLNPDVEDETMDTSITMFINSAIDDLARIGVGQYGWFALESKTETWNDYLGETYISLLSSIKAYVSIYAKLHFDTPQGTLLTALEDRLLKLDFTIQTAIELQDESESPKL